MSAALSVCGFLVAFADPSQARPQLSAGADRYACSAPPGHIDVTASVSRLAVSADVSSEQLAAAARSSGKLRHPPLGFYLDRVAYRVEIHEPQNAPPGCAPEARVTVQIALIDRHVEIASDLRRDPCLFQAALNHYRHHAAAGAWVFREFMRTFAGRMQASLADPDSGSSDKRGNRGDVHAALEQQLALLDRARREAQAKVDSQSEIDGLIRPACST